MRILPDNFCRLPWNGLDVGPQGGFKPCCKYREDIAQDLDGYLHSEKLDLLRQEFLSGQHPAGCQRCWDDEAAGIPSKRQLDNAYTFGGQEVVLDGVRTLSLPFGNTCNLACVTCGSHSSSRWVTDERKLPNRFGRQIFGHSQFYRDPGFLDRIAGLCDDVIHIDIPGGEPFFSDRDLHLGFLQQLKNPHNIKLHYTTNGTVYPDPEFWAVWSRFRATDIQVSIDGVGDRFEYIRHPAQWHEVEKNLFRYRDQGTTQISISHTVSWLNVMYLDEFVGWCQTNSLPEPYLGPVSRPAYLDARCLPSAAKSRIAHHLRSSSHAMVRQFADYLLQDLDRDLWTQAQDWVAELDRLRDRDWRQTFPELEQVIQNP